MTDTVKTKVRVETEGLPDGHAEWQVALPNDPALAVAYNMGMYDILAVAIGKFGVIYAQWVIDQDNDAYQAAVQELKRSIVG